MRQGRIHSNGQVLVSTAWLANRPWSRLRGLLWREPLAVQPAQALWLLPCGAVHTFGMRYALDLVFLDRQGRVLDCAEQVAPGRWRRARGAHQTVEFAAGALRQLKPVTRDTWTWEVA